MDELISNVIRTHGQLLDTHPYQLKHFMNKRNILQIYKSNTPCAPNRIIAVKFPSFNRAYT